MSEDADLRRFSISFTSKGFRDSLLNTVARIEGTTEGVTNSLRVYSVTITKDRILLLSNVLCLGCSITLVDFYKRCTTVYT